DEDDAEDAEDFDVGDAVGKALALINQIRKSPQAKAYFRTTCKEVDVPVLQLLLWIRTPHQTFSAANRATLWAAIPVLENLQENW
ncbi:hypothetical protein FOMPIDRAFT_1109610, partial [Fomitopsis schrenkii]